MNTKEQLELSCKSIANELTNGIVMDESNIDEYDDWELGENVSASTYLEGSFDIEYTITSDLDYKGAKIAVALGGPSIYISTNTNEVVGYWGSDRVTVPFTDNIGVDAYCEELYESKRFIL